MQPTANTQTLDQFVAHVFAEEYKQAMMLCSTDVKFVVFRNQSDHQVPIYGAHIGQAAGTLFFKNLAQLFEFGAFEMDDSIENDHYIVRFGELAHTVKRTGNVFNSLWTMIVRFDETGKICLYRMHEDTVALEAALCISR